MPKRGHVCTKAWARGIPQTSSGIPMPEAVVVAHEPAPGFDLSQDFGAPPPLVRRDTSMLANLLNDSISFSGLTGELNEAFAMTATALGEKPEVLKKSSDPTMPVPRLTRAKSSYYGELLSSLGGELVSDAQKGIVPGLQATSASASTAAPPVVSKQASKREKFTNRFGSSLRALLKAAEAEKHFEKLDEQEYTPQRICTALGKRGADRVIGQLVEELQVPRGAAEAIVDEFIV
jgi:hypothetical protein